MHGRAHHPETDFEADTIEFEPVSPEVLGRVEYVLRDGIGIQIPKRHHVGDIEIRLGQSDKSSPCFLRRVRDVPVLKERFSYELILEGDQSLWAIVQPDVMTTDPELGWLEIREGEGGTTLGRFMSPELRLGPDVARMDHCSVSVEDTWLFIDGQAASGTTVVVDAANRLNCYALEGPPRERASG